VIEVQPAHENLCHLSAKVLYCNKCSKKTDGEPAADPGSSGKQPSSQRYASYGTQHKLTTWTEAAVKCVTWIAVMAQQQTVSRS